jgi:hypothetical protein
MAIELFSLEPVRNMTLPRSLAVEIGRGPEERDVV